MTYKSEIETRDPQEIRIAAREAIASLVINHLEPHDPETEAALRLAVEHQVMTVIFGDTESASLRLEL